ncbi:MAG: YbaB/EbfC family nucleoid-associated protein [Christensenellales bacterium]
MARGGFPNMGGANMQQLMRQAQKMQQDMQRAQEELQAREFSATAGGGVVTAVVNGAKQLTKLTISPDCVDPDDVEMLEALVTAAVNEALRNAAETAEREMGRITGGMGLGF